MKERDVQSVQQLQDKLSALQGTQAAQSAAETRWRGERTALLSQLDTLNDHLVRAQHRIEALEGDNRKMQQVCDAAHDLL
jgi:chromosome segregation ATPase